MNTPSHLIMTAALCKALRKRVSIPRSAALLGSVAPDLPVYLISAGGLVYYRAILGWDNSAAFQHMFDELYFRDPFWLAAHNMLHSPTLLVLGLIGIWLTADLRRPGPRWILWFLTACLFHSLVDVFTHNNDGPLLFFPFDWSMRFPSPVSYWDPNYYGRYFARSEICLDVALLVYLLAGNRMFSLSRRGTAGQELSDPNTL